MKRAFTLVELAIVLVIIGILMGLVMKGKSLLDSARMQSEVHKIRKMEIALNTYFIDTEMQPPDVNNPGAFKSMISSKPLVDRGMLSAKDMSTPYCGNGFKLGFWMCTDKHEQSASGNKGWDYVHSGQENWRSNDVCIMCSDIATEENRANFYTVYSCSIENILDDKNVKEGEGRLVKAQYNDVFPNKFDSCRTITNVQKGYAFRIVRND